MTTIRQATPRPSRLAAAAVLPFGAWIVLTGAQRAGPPDEPWERELARHPCSAEARAAMDEWGQLGPLTPTPPIPGLVAQYRFPTDDIAEWVVLELPAAGAASRSTPVVTRLTPEGVDRRTWSTECVPTAEVTPASGAVVGGGGLEPFTDADLRSAVPEACGQSPATVVYTWSPHMPLSVDGYATIRAATEELGLRLVPVLFTGSDPEFSRAEALRKGIPETGLREAASVEMTLRNALVHAPTILVFSGSRTPGLLPGYRTPGGYVEFLERFLTDSCPSDPSSVGE